MTNIVLFGGRSSARRASVASAQVIVRAMDNLRDRETPQRHDRALAWFWAPNGMVHDVNLAEFLAHQNPLTDDFEPSRPAIWPDLEMALDTLPVDDPVFVLALGVREKEDVQRMMESRGISFTSPRETPF